MYHHIWLLYIITVYCFWFRAILDCHKYIHIFKKDLSINGRKWNKYEFCLILFFFNSSQPIYTHTEINCSFFLHYCYCHDHFTHVLLFNLSYQYNDLWFFTLKCKMVRLFNCCICLYGYDLWWKCKYCDMKYNSIQLYYKFFNITDIFRHYTN